MVNGQSKAQSPSLVIPQISETPDLFCHRFFAPVVFPEPDALDPRKVNIRPKISNFSCIKEKCTLWNPEKSECYDVTSAKAQTVIAEYAFNKANDVHIQGGGL